MNVKKQPRDLAIRWRLHAWLLGLVWTGCIAASLFWNLWEQENKTRLLARNSAQITFENDLLYRHWVAAQGGVYVPVSPQVPPNPYLQVSDRDITTTAGLTLTLVNPAYMTRMVHQRAAETKGSRGHITSLKPLRPENAPDAWEAVALRSFEEGVPEVSCVQALEANLQVISSLVALQAERLPEAAMRPVFQDVAHRVRSMALVHERLYQSSDLARVEFAEYARSLLTYLWRAHTATASGIRLVLDLEPISISINAAVPCGLILNELVSNALKHAFRGRTEGKVAVSLRGTPEGRVCLRVRDNGVGLPAEFDWQQADSLGLRLIQLLAGQLHATVETTRDGGTAFAVVFDEANSLAMPPSVY
ncbi:MAG: histidine kinase dimerization/phosphoacceptor domain -containing protein [Pirellulaceae bacterium]